MRTESPSLQPKWLNPQLPREGRYVLGPLLGKGGMGEVVEAWDVVLCRTVALKFLRDMEPSAMIRFMHEAQIQARVIHPNICRIYDIDSSEGTLKIAMQLIQGPSLEQAASQLSIDEVVTIMGQMAEAVHAAHRVNLIHRDLKPSNVILERSADGRWTPYLCDFGLAVSLGEPAMTLSHAVLGTPAFMAPEQTRGDRDGITPATDVFALGGTLHFALMGYPPGQLASTPDQRRTPKPGLPRDLETIIGKCLEQDPSRRYPTAAALAEDLWRFHNGEPIQASRRRRFPALPRRGRRLPALAAALGALSLVLAVLLAWKLHSNARDQAQVEAILLEMDGAVDDYRSHLIQPVHDLRGVRPPLEACMDGIRARLGDTSGPARAAAWFGLGRGLLALGRPGEALDAFQKAEAAGFDPERLQAFIARARLGALCWDPDPAPTSLPDAFDSRQSPYQAALASFLRKDFAAAAAGARLAQKVHPSQSDTAGLEAASLCALGRERFQAGDLAGAQDRFREARDSAAAQLGLWQSNPGVHHAYAQASLGLAEVQMERGIRSLPLLQELGSHCDLALRLDPQAPELLEDWLATRFLLVRQLAALGQDPRQELEGATAFLGALPQKARTPVVVRGGFLLQWQKAQASLRHAQDPGPALVEALRAVDTPPIFIRDYRGEILLFKARLEASRGEDPRPTLDAALDRYPPGAQGQTPWPSLETLAETWLFRAHWERTRSLDAQASLGKARALAEEALRICPTAPAANAIRDAALAMEARRPLPGRIPVGSTRDVLLPEVPAGGSGGNVHPRDRGRPRPT